MLKISKKTQNYRKPYSLKVTRRRKRHIPVRQLQSHKKADEIYKITITPYHKKLRSSLHEASLQDLTQKRPKKVPQLRSQSEILSKETQRTQTSFVPSTKRSRLNLNTSMLFKSADVPKKKVDFRKRPYSRMKSIARGYIEEFQRLNGNVKQVESLGKTEEVENMMSKEFIRRKFAKFMAFLKKLDRLHSGSLAEFLRNLT